MPRIRNGRENAKNKRNRVFAIADVDKELFNWVVNTASGLPRLSGQICFEKARKIASDLQYDNTDKSDIKWIKWFKARHMVYASKFHGEASAVNIGGLNEWKANVLPSILKHTNSERFQC